MIKPSKDMMITLILLHNLCKLLLLSSSNQIFYKQYTLFYESSGELNVWTATESTLFHEIAGWEFP
jgi:hypothetical protein